VIAASDPLRLHVDLFGDGSAGLLVFSDDMDITRFV
jgi:hypothetical protein